MKSKCSLTVNNLYKAILVLKTADETSRFFSDLLTPQEIMEFANRWQVAQMLSNKVPYSAIEKETGMSSTTIARVSKFLNGEFGGYRLVLERMSQAKQPRRLYSTLTSGIKGKQKYVSENRHHHQTAKFEDGS